jgi:predicted dehydrogenase
MTQNTNGSKNKRRKRRKIRYAVAGLGWISQVALLPAFKNAENSELAALVSDDAEKLKALGETYHVKNLYTYEQYDDCLQSGEVDAVYIGLPNHLHREYTVRAALAGIHIFCEKPMAVKERECEEMIRAAEDHNVKLMIAYRLHFEAGNLEAIKLTNDGTIGDAQFFTSVNTQQVEQDNVRWEPISKGGGPVYDIGVYCINASRYLFQAEPAEVYAALTWHDAHQETRVEDKAAVVMKYPDNRLASFVCGFGQEGNSRYEVIGTKGMLRADPAYGFMNDITLHITREGKTDTKNFPARDQFGPQLVYFSNCILDGREPEPSGIEGLNDIRIIRAIHKSGETGKPVALDLVEKRKPSKRQEISRPPVESPELVNAESPSGQ